MKNGGEFEKAIINIVADAKYKRPTRRIHRDKVGMGAVLERCYGPGINERPQIAEPLFHQVRIVPGEEIRAVRLSAPGMNAGFENKNRQG